jgi:formylmethanofuran dehydrogenase subunit E
MNRAEFEKYEDFMTCVAFHGHICPGLAIGYRAAKEGMKTLDEHRSVDEEVVAIVENNACGTDAVQVLTGCTFGKGNLIHKDYGKQVFAFLGRDSGKGVRLAMRADVMKRSDEHQELMDKIRQDTATEEEKKRFWMLHGQKSRDVLDMPVDRLFSKRLVDMDLPPKAKIEPSIPCDNCGEPTMASKLTEQGGQKLCGECMES